LGIGAQRKAVEDYLSSVSGVLTEEFVEVESGRRPDRPQLTQALACCKRNKADLVVAKLDRLARNVAFISKLMEAGVHFVAADMPEANRLTIHVMAAFAEYERELISIRVKAALAVAKSRGVKLGGPKIRVAQANARISIMSKYARLDANVLPIIRQIQSQGVKTYVAIAKALTSRSVPTPRGAEKWCPCTVARILGRAEYAGYLSVV
jgi:DNA invertase Pin-like site-specific DNA recombinase